MSDSENPINPLFGAADREVDIIIKALAHLWDKLDGMHQQLVNIDNSTDAVNREGIDTYPQT